MTLQVNLAFEGASGSRTGGAAEVTSSASYPIHITDADVMHAQIQGVFWVEFEGCLYSILTADQRICAAISLNSRDFF